MTNNELLDKILYDLNELIGWTQADMHASREVRAIEQAREDRARLKRLEKARALLRESPK